MQNTKYVAAIVQRVKCIGVLFHDIVQFLLIIIFVFVIRRLFMQYEKNIMLPACTQSINIMNESFPQKKQK